MSVQFVLGSSGAGKSHYVYEKVIRQSMKEPEGTFLVIVPEQFTLQTQKDLVVMHPNKGIMNIDILSFVRLAYRVFEEVGGNDRLVLEDTGKSMVIKKVVMEKKNDLVLYGANIKKQGFIEEMKSVISELLQYSISPEQLTDMEALAANRPMLRNKMKDIQTIYQGFQDFMREKYITPEEILDLLCDVIDKSVFMKECTIVFDGFTGFTPAQYKLLEHLMKLTKKIYITLAIDKRQAKKVQKEHDLFYLSGNTMEKVSKIAAKNCVDIEDPIIIEDYNKKELGISVPYRFLQSDALASLEHNLYRYPYREFKGEQKDITITAAKDLKSEVLLAVTKIKELVREEKYRYKDIAVVTGAMESYGDALKDEFLKAKIPCFIDNKQNILTNPMVEFIRSALEMETQNYSYDGVFRFLKSGLSGWDHEEIDVFENYVIALGIRGHHRYESEWKRNYRTQYEIPLEYLNELRERFIDEMREFHEVFSNTKSTVKERLAALFYFMRKFKIEESIKKLAEKFKEEGTEEARLKAKEYEQVYQIVLDIFDRMAELLGNDVMPLKEFTDILESGIKEAKVGLIPPGIDQIVVGDIERTRLKDIKALFFLGVNDGIVPKANPGGGILTDADRQLFAEYDIELSPTKRQNAYITEFYLYLNLTKPQNKLFISYAKLDAGGKAMRASYLIGKMLKLFPDIMIAEPDLSNLSEREQNLDYVLGADDGLGYLIDGLREFETRQSSDVFLELYHLYLSGEIPSPVTMEYLADGVFYHNKEKGISKEVAKKLYGETLLGSVTRMEKYASCAFAHFLKFGLLLEERAEYQVSVPDIGNIFHEALEIYSEKLKESEFNWHTVPEEVRNDLSHQAVVEAVKDYGNGILESTKRNAYIIKKVERILLRTVKTLSEQLKAGEFEPLAYEKSFSHADRFLNLKGRIDRLDVYEDEGKLYVKVIDYKSGSTSFDLMSLYYGLQLQLGVYLTAGLNLMREAHPNKEILPAGVFYYNLDDPIVEKSDHVEKDIRKKLAMNGLVNSSGKVLPLLDHALGMHDGGLSPSVKSEVIPVETNKNGELTKRSSVATLAQFEKLCDYIYDLMNQFSLEIMGGRTIQKPFCNKNKTACDYCSYKAVCGFDTRVDGYEFHRLRQMSADDVWAKIMEEEEDADGED